MNDQIQTATASPAVKQQVRIEDPLADNFFTPVANTKPYFKAGIQGLAGTGKTYTAAEIAIGLHKRLGSKKPIVMFDSEKASKFLKTKFAEAGIELMVRDSRTLADLKKTMEKLRDGYADILIIDSISHVWEDTVESFKKKYNRSSLQFQDWGVLKPLWKQEFSDPLVRLPFSIIMCGRAGYEYENEINEQTGKREIYKSGIKMKVEGETAYEPDVLVLMERFEEVLGKDKKIYRQATIIKDRSTLIDGKVFMNPTYKDFAPVIENMLDNPATSYQDEVSDSTGLFRNEEDKYQYINEKKICLEEIEGWMVKAWPSTGASDKQKKIEVLDKVFNTRSWLAVESKGLAELKGGLEKIKVLVNEELTQQFPDKAKEKEEGAAAKAMKKGMEKSKESKK